MYGRQQYDLDKNIFRKEKNWNQRFGLEKIPKFDAYNDVNYPSLGLLKSKIRYEERKKKEESNFRYAGRIYSALYLKTKSTPKFPKNKNYKNYNKNTLITSNNKKRNPSMRISLDHTVNFNNIEDKKKTINNFQYQGFLETQNVAGSQTFNYMPDYKNKNLKFNIIHVICEDDPEIRDEYELVR